MKLRNYLIIVLTVIILILAITVLISIRIAATDSQKADHDSLKDVVEVISAQIYQVEQDMKGHYVDIVYDPDQAKKYGKKIGPNGNGSDRVYVKISQEEGIKRANAIMKNATFGSGYIFNDKTGSYAFALTDDVKIAAIAPDGLAKGFNLQKSHKQFVDNAIKNKNGQAIYYSWKDQNGTFKNLVGYSKRTPVLHWTICASKLVTPVSTLLYRVLMDNLILIIVNLILILVTVIYIIPSIFLGMIKNIKTINNTLYSLVNREPNVVIPVYKAGTAFGSMSASLMDFRDKMKESDANNIKIKENQKRAEEVTKKQQVYIADFKNSIGTILSKVNTNITDINEKSTSSGVGIVASLEFSQSVKTLSTEASEDLSHISAAAEQLNESIVEISASINQGAKRNSVSVTQGEKAVNTINNLVTSVDKISEVAQLINDIADQTNLLALNATIEAARAGEAGKGFAVVASEVKNLAAQTAKATENITTQIDTVQNVTKEATEAVNFVLDELGSSADRFNSAAAAIEEQAVTIADVTKNLDEANNKSSKITNNITTIDGKLTDNNTLAKEMETSSSNIMHSTQNLEKEINDFLAKVSDL